MEQEQRLQLKMLFLLGYDLLFSGGMNFGGGREKNLVQREPTGGGVIFLGGGE